MHSHMALRLLAAPQPAQKTVTRRGHSKAPDDLARLIEVVNAERLYERELPDLKAIWRAVLYDAVRDLSQHTFVIPEIRKRATREVVARLAPETRMFLGPVEDDLFLQNWNSLQHAGV